MTFGRIVLACAGLFTAACLPKDVRPVPSRVDVTLTAVPLADETHTFVTADGWAVSFDRVLASLRASLDGDGCADYYNDGYTRILDLGVAGHQHLVSLYSLGHCDFSFRVQSPSTDPYTPLGEHVTPADHAFLNAPGIDPYVKDRKGNPILTGIAFYVKGHASNGAVTKTFAWPFRQRAFYEECTAPHVVQDAGTIRDASTIHDVGSVRDAAALDASSAADAASAADASLPLFTDAGSPGPKGLDLASGGARSIDVQMNARAVFFDTTNLAVASPRFDVIALADDHYGNGDGDVTLEELGLVPLSDVGGGGRYEQPNAATAEAPWKTLEDFVYVGLYPSVARFEGTGTCMMGLGSPPER